MKINMINLYIMIVALIIFSYILFNEREKIWWMIIFLTIGYISSLMIFEDDKKANKDERTHTHIKTAGTIRIRK